MIKKQLQFDFLLFARARAIKNLQKGLRLDELLGKQVQYTLISNEKETVLPWTPPVWDYYCFDSKGSVSFNSVLCVFVLT